VVDAAWGAHFGFHPAYPAHAMSLGADAMITSAHKTLPAFSQGSIVLARTKLLDRDRLERGFEATATTSPAGSILASIDASRALLASPVGHDLLGRLVEITAAARRRLRSELTLSGVLIPGPDDFGPNRIDPVKLVLLLAKTRLSGVALERELLTLGSPLEQADRDLMIPIVSMVDDQESLDLFCNRLIAAAQRVDPIAERPTTASPVWQTRLPPAAMTPRDAFFADHETIDWYDAAGRISAEVVAPYPPGVPVLVPGELITTETLDALETAAASGVRIAYAADPSLKSFQVVRR
ncbi:MAG: decarboxylase, partial [Actinobacteria bacterium]|nr:decarboxylase [Actinomycetota bacterium]